MAEQIIFMLHTQLQRHPRNMRRTYRLADVRRMAVSQADRARRGEPPCVQPIIVTPGAGERPYDSRKHPKLIIVAGHLRHAGNVYLGREAPRLNCVLRYYANEADMLADMSAENGIRAEVGPVSWAWHYQSQLADGKTVGQVARDAGKSVHVVNETLQLLKLGQVAQDLIEAGDLALGACAHLVRVTDGRVQAAAARKFVSAGFSVRQMEVAVDAICGGQAPLKRVGRPAKPGKAQPPRRIIKMERVKNVDVPSLVGKPAALPATLGDLRTAAREICGACEIGGPLNDKEPAWHLATAAAGQVCTACDLRTIKDACSACPLPEMLSRVTRDLAGKRPGNRLVAGARA